MPAERASASRNGIERAIAAMAASPTLRGLGLYADQMSGAEWWVQDVAPDELPKTFHTDCDMQTVQEEDSGGSGRGLHWFTSSLNLSAFYGIGGARRGCVTRVKGVLRGCVGCFCVSDTAQVELKSEQV